MLDNHALLLHIREVFDGKEPVALAVAEHPCPLGAAADFELKEVGFCTLCFSLLLAHRKRQASELGALNYCRRASLAENLGYGVR